MKKSKRILVAPLDWGLGHAARCVPIIRKLLEHHTEVLIAGDGGSQLLLQQEFPKLASLPLKGYRPNYPKNGGMVRQMALQTPKFLRTIHREHAWLKDTVKRHAIDAVISDNRYGLWTKLVPCILINHQLNVLMPAHFKLLEPAVNRLNWWFAQKYTECWVPDGETANNISGQLSQPSKALRNKIRYIGPLSRLEKAGSAGTGYELVVLLSGPEPQRSVLEEKLEDQLLQLKTPTLLVQGIPGLPKKERLNDFVEMTSYLTAAQLNPVLAAAQTVVARAGYSTIMDLIHLGKRAILIPTPGQTEQEYLANRMHDNGWFYTVPQQSLDLGQAIRDVRSFQPPEPNETSESFEMVISELLDRLEP